MIVTEPSNIVGGLCLTTADAGRREGNKGKVNPRAQHHCCTVVQNGVRVPYRYQAEDEAGRYLSLSRPHTKCAPHL